MKTDLGRPLNEKPLGRVSEGRKSLEVWKTASENSNASGHNWVRIILGTGWKR